MRSVSTPQCARCGAPTAWVVARCLECSGRRLAFLTARAAVDYDGPVRPLVGAWKERGLRHAAELAADLTAERLAPPTVDVVTWVPADPDRQLTRGHHPAERLARALARRWELEARPLLIRAGGSRRQAELALDARRTNVREAFRPRGDPPPHVLLVDDVYTTGATADAGAAALRGAGAQRVEVVAFARAVR